MVQKKQTNSEAQAPKTSLVTLATSLDIFTFLSGADFLRKLYKEVKRNRAKYSYRTFAAELGFGQSNYLHLICTGTRQFSVKAAEKIAIALQFAGKQTKYLALLAKYECSRNASEREFFFEEMLEMKGKLLPSALTKGHLEYFSSWHHSVVRELVLLPDFSSEPEWLSNRIVPKITPEEARASWSLLCDLGYVEWNGELNRWVQSQARIVVPAGAKDIAIVRYHQKMAELGKESVTRIKARFRDISALTVCMDEEFFEALKEQISMWKKQVLERSENLQNPEEVYQLNVQLFPVSLKEKV